jgi:hypothetical protein
MLKLPIRTWICNAAAVFSSRHGTVSQQARTADCSRQTVYNHARHVEHRLLERDRQVERLRAEIGQLKRDAERDRDHHRSAVPIVPDALERFAVTAQAMGVSLRQAEELLGTLLPADRVPDHATLGRWTAAAGRRAAAVLAALDPVCAPAVRTLCVDEIFFGG